jgi:hypothetical protein
MDYGRLLNFYVACVEEEDLRSRQVKADMLNRQFIVPQADTGALFRSAENISWNISNEQRRFLERYSAELEPPRYLYGYPVYRDRTGFLLPLFMSEADVEIDEQKITANLRLIHPSNIQVNLHLFRWTHPSLAERLGLQDMLEASDFGTFESRLQKALEERQEQHSTLEQVTTPPGTQGWKNGSLVFYDTGGIFSNQLRRELADMRNMDLSKKAVGTALGTLLESKNQTRTSTDVPELFEIMPLNRSQREAATAALSEPLTVITGPPGTGKSQVVINLITSMEAAGRRVLFASKNNRAVDVVRDKIAEILDYDDWTLRLGSKNKIDEERQVRTEQAMALEQGRPEMRRERSEELHEHLQQRRSLELENDNASLAVTRYADSLLVLRKRVAQLSESWQEWWDNEATFDWPHPKQERTVANSLDDVRALSGKQWPGLWLWFRRFFLGPRLMRKYEENFLKVSGGAPNTIPEWRSKRHSGWQGLLDDYQVLHSLYECRRAVEDLGSALSDLERVPLAAEFREDIEKYCNGIVECARDTCRARIRNPISTAAGRLPILLGQYFDLTKRAVNPHPNIARQIQHDFSRAANALLSVTPAVIVTSLSARRSLPFEPEMFDCVIIDEASQCDIASALPLLLRAKRLVVIGDPQQLRHVSSIDERTEQELAHSEGAEHLLTDYSYRRKSLFDCAAKTYDDCGRQPFFLAEHYRSHPEIIEFSNRTYYRPNYNMGLIIRTPSEHQQNPGVMWHDVPSEVDRPRGSLLNRNEAEEVVDVLATIVSGGSFRDKWTIGVVTPYNRQRNYIRSLLQSAGLLDLLGNRLKVGNVHTFQGSEADIVVFSPVVAAGADPRAAEWISKEEGLLNVALTRARKILHIVGDKDYCASTRGPLGKLAKFVDQLTGEQRSRPEETSARTTVREMLKELVPWYQEEGSESDGITQCRLDFVVVGLSGTRYDIEIDGRQHYFSAEAIMEDEARDAFLKKRGYQVIRIRAMNVDRHPDTVRSLLSRLA